jgi:hypothetical protein
MLTMPAPTQAGATLAARAPDKYDRAIAYLKDKPHEIHLAWDTYRVHPAGCLFQKADFDPRTFRCGCLTQVAAGTHCAGSEEITQLIRADECIPSSPYFITPDSLDVFAEWQRKLDKYFDRV